MSTRALIPTAFVVGLSVAALTSFVGAAVSAPAAPDTTLPACFEPTVWIWAPTGYWGTKVIELTWPQLATTFNYSVEVCDEPVVVAVEHLDNWSDGPTTFELTASADLTEPIAAGETVMVRVLNDGGTLDEDDVTAIPGDPPPLDCARAVCAWGLTERVFPEWVDVGMQVDDGVRAVEAVVSRARDRVEVGRYPMTLVDGTAEVRLRDLASSTSYTTEYVVTDHGGRSTVELTGAFVTAGR